MIYNCSRDGAKGLKLDLTEEVVQEIINKDLNCERLSLVRDIFLFSCFTGVAYIDVINLTPSLINIGIDGERWIDTALRKPKPLLRVRYFR